MYVVQTELGTEVFWLMMISRPNKYLFVPFLGSYLHGTEVTSFENDLFIYRWTIFFICFCFCSLFYFSQGQSGAALSAEKLRYPG